MRNGQREIPIIKKDLIEQIKANKEAHIYEYEKAVSAYQMEALDQLKALTKKVKKGERNITLSLTEPVNNTKNYDKIIQMFEWDTQEQVVLSQTEFNEYVLDENHYNETAKMSNMAYSDKWL